MKKITLLFIFSLVFFNCQNESKSKNLSKDIVATKTLSSEEKIYNFLDTHSEVTNESYQTLFNYIKEDYLKNKKNDKYEVLIHSAKKTLKETDIKIKNISYRNLKEEFYKLRK